MSHHQHHQHQNQNPETELPQQEAQAEAVEPQATAEAAVEPTPEQLAQRVAELEAELADINKYHQAELQNLGRRHQEEIQAAHKFAAKKFAEELLKVKDYLEMALLDQSGNFDALKMGVQMTLNELQKAFDATHIKEINPQPGEMLDPHQHQAMQAEESGQEANSIIRVLKKGYLLNDRILRPAMVVVAKSAENAE